MKRLRKTLELRFAVITAIALLFAQFGAQAHAYTHLRMGSGPSSGEQLDSHGRQCNDCLAFAPLLAKAGGHSLPLVPAAQGVEIAAAATVVSLAARAVTPGFRSRAPPSIPR